MGLAACSDADVATLAETEDPRAVGWSLVAVAHRGLESPAVLDLSAPTRAWVPLGPTRASGYAGELNETPYIVAVSPDGSVAVVRSGDGLFALHRAEAGVARRLDYPVGRNAPTAFVIDPTSTFVAFRADEALYVALLDGSQPAAAVVRDAPFVTAQFSGDGDYLVVDAEPPIAVPVAGGTARVLPYAGRVVGPYAVRQNGNVFSILDLRRDASPVEVDVGRYNVIGFFDDTYAVLEDSDTGVARLALEGPAELVPVVRIPDELDESVLVRHVHEDLVVYERYANDAPTRRALFAQSLVRTSSASMLVDWEEAPHFVFAADDDAVYLCRGGSVERVPRDGRSAPAIILETDNVSCGDGGLTAGHVYVCPAGDCQAVAAQGGAPIDLGASAFAVPYGFVATRDHTESAVFVVDETQVARQSRPWGPRVFSTRVEREWLFVFDAEGTHAVPLDGTAPLRRIGPERVSFVAGDTAFAVRDYVVWAQGLDGGAADAPVRIDPGVRVLELEGQHDGRLVVRTDDGFALVVGDGQMEPLPSSRGGLVAIDERRERLVWTTNDGVWKRQAGRSEQVASEMWLAPLPVLDDTGRYLVTSTDAWRSSTFDLDDPAHPRADLPGAPLAFDREGRIGTKGGLALLHDGVGFVQASLQGGAGANLVRSFQQVVFDDSGVRGVAVDVGSELVYFAVGESSKPLNVQAVGSSLDLALVGRHVYFPRAETYFVSVVDVDDGEVVDLLDRRTLGRFEALPTSGFVFQTNAAPHRIEIGEGAERRELLVEVDEGRLWVAEIVPRYAEP